MTVASGTPDATPVIQDTGSKAGKSGLTVKDHATSLCGVMIFWPLVDHAMESANVNRDEVMQKLVEENKILRKRVQELQLQLEKKTRIAVSLGRVISTLTTEEADN
ncbi:hypothetical protein Taro_055655 [Colocasia esculenta]|uniref:Uncharacterized protein n=1 Tax=Colocasia esculenta TaxID=4460 RepID=A0A843XUA8_COLES|nr:hypothetical protein [Colocasia esculenta]